MASLPINSIHPASNHLCKSRSTGTGGYMLHAENGKCRTAEEEDKKRATEKYRFLRITQAGESVQGTPGLELRAAGQLQEPHEKDTPCPKRLLQFISEETS